MRYSFLRLFVLTLVLLSVVGQTMALAESAQQTARRTIFDYKTELNLTDEQETHIRQILADLDKDLRISRAKLTLLHYELQDLIKKEGDLAVIRRKLEEQAGLRASARFADLEASRKVNTVLSSDQLRKWRALQAAARATQELEEEGEAEGS